MWQPLQFSTYQWVVDLGEAPFGVSFPSWYSEDEAPAQVRVLAWDLAITLAPFEPLDLATNMCIALKVAFLLAITSLKRVGDLRALLVASSCIEFAPGRVKAILHSRSGYVPKVPTNVARSTFLQALYPPPHVSAEQEKLHLLCPVRALDIYISKTSQWRKTDQLLVCFGPPKKKCPATKQTISRWIVEAISMAYVVRGLPSPLQVRAHSTQSVASSSALLSGASLQEVCDHPCTHL